MSQPEETRSKTAESDDVLLHPGEDQGEVRVTGAVDVRQVMTVRPVAVPSGCTLTEAARHMRDNDIGAVIVQDGQQVRGIVTDRDIVVRAVAEDAPPNDVTVGEICSAEVVTVRPYDDVDRAVRLMRAHALRRLPVVDDGQVVGVVSLGDLALDRDPRSVLADISAAQPNA